MYIQRTRYYFSLFLRIAATCLLLGVVFVYDTELPAGELAAQWHYLSKAGLLYFILMLLSIVAYPYRKANIHPENYRIVTWVFILYGGIEAVWGLACQ